MKNNNLIVEVAHVTEIYGPVQALENYLKRNSNEFIMIEHPLSLSSLNYSTCKIYIDGKLMKATKRKVFKLSEPLFYAQHFLLTFFFLMKMRRKIDIFIGVDNLNAFVGILLKKWGLVNKVVFYVIDYTPKRFENKLFNILYYLLDITCAKHADYVWSVSKRIARVWSSLGVNHRKIVIVPIGVNFEEIKKYTHNTNVRRNVLVFVSHLTKSKGIQLTIEAMEELLRKFPEVKLEVIGTGPFEKELKEIVSKKKLERWVKFLGKMKHEELMQYLPSCGIALATYEPDPNSITYYADPTKLKEYLACGLPVITTRVPWIAKEIEKRPMGIVINYDKYELINAITKLLSDNNFYDLCKKNAVEFTSELDWNKIFNSAFAKIQ
jgi:glycosyltransferase involved in cell wall biosynthesis